MSRILRQIALALAVFAGLAGNAYAGAVPLPEPGTLMLLAGGVAAVLIVRSRRK